MSNQPSACRKYYIHPRILDSYVNGDLLRRAGQHVAGAQRNVKRQKVTGLESEEWVMLKLLAGCA